jgi:excisionase family DNA binding protein
MMGAMSAHIMTEPAKDHVMAKPTRKLPDPEVQPVMSVKEAATHLHINEKTAYAAVNAGKIPSVRFGARVVVPTAAFRRMLGLDLEQQGQEPAAS